MVDKRASDLFVTVDAPPSLKVDGQVLPIKTDVFGAQASQDLAFSLMSEDQQTAFEVNKDLNFAVNPEKLGRFRVNVFQQQGQVGMVIHALARLFQILKR